MSSHRRCSGYPISSRRHPLVVDKNRVENWIDRYCKAKNFSLSDEQADADEAGAEGEEPPEYYRDQMDLADRWQATVAGTDEYYTLGTELVGNTVKQMLQIGTVGEVPVIYTRSNRLHNFPNENMIFIDHLRGAHSDQWYLSE